MKHRDRLAGLAALLVLAGCGSVPGGHPSSASVTHPPSAGASGRAGEEVRDPAATRQTEPQDPTDAIEHVVVISVDGLASKALTELGAAGAPALRLLRTEGAGTLNARTAYEATVTLPNHVGMMTGRAIDQAAGGHGVTWNDDRPHDTVQAAARDPHIESIFSVAHAAGLTTAFFAGKTKFGIFPDSWPEAFDYVDIRDGKGGLEEQARAVSGHLVGAHPHLTFWHISSPDVAGHIFGGMTPEYLDAVSATDAAVGRIMGAVTRDRQLDGHTLIVLTADHGVAPGARSHNRQVPSNYRIPFLVWGAGVTSGDLYQLNPTLADPGAGRPSYRGPQPVRNQQVSAVVLEALGLPRLGAGAVVGGPLVWR